LDRASDFESDDTSRLWHRDVFSKILKGCSQLPDRNQRFTRERACRQLIGQVLLAFACRIHPSVPPVE
jgi:hypothetical protein